MRAVLRWVARQAAATWCGVRGHHWLIGPTLVSLTTQRTKQGPVVCSRCGKAGW